MNKIRLSKSSISQDEKQAVLKVLEKEYLGMGEEVKLFEEKIKNYLQTDMDVACVSTGTSALHLSLSALGLKTGDEVLVPSLTYVASYQAISSTGAKPVSCEVNPNTLFLDSDDARAKITKNTKAIMPVHYASSSKGMDKVYKLAQDYGLRVVEDAAQAFGIEKDTQMRYANQRSWTFDVKEQGYRYHMSNIMAAIGIVQIDRIEAFRNKRQSIANIYYKAFQDIEQIKLLDYDFNDILPHIIVIKTQKRDELREFLIGNNIECGIQYKPNHQHTKYAEKFTLPLTDNIYNDILSLPCHFDLTKIEQDYVIQKLRDFSKG